MARGSPGLWTKWLDSLFLNLACGSPVVLVLDSAAVNGEGRPLHTLRGAFERLLTPGTDFIRLTANHSEPSALCEAVDGAMRWLDERPQLARCIGASGQRKVRALLRPEWVHEYMASLLRRIGAMQAGEPHRMRVGRHHRWLRLNLTCCVHQRDATEQRKCVARAIRERYSLQRPWQWPAPRIDLH